MKALHMRCKDCDLNRSAVSWPSVAVSLILAAILCASCTHQVRPDPSPVYTPTKGPTEALIDSCENVRESKEVRCPLDVFLKGIYNFADLWEYSQKCRARLEAAEKYGAIDRAELQGRVNEEAARADRNARWIWYTVGGGLVLSIITLVVGAVAL